MRLFGTNPSNLWAFVAPAVVALAFPTHWVWAAGMEYPDNGTIAIGRGGAHAANPEDGLAFQYNPAGFAQAAQRGFRLHLDTRWAAQGLRFQSATPDAAAVENSAPPFLAPAGAISYGLGKVGPLSDLAFAVGATGPSAVGKTSFPVDGAQRYALTSTAYFIAYYSAAVAAGWQRGDVGVRVGFTGQLVQGTAKFSQAVWSGIDTYDNAKKGNKPSDTKNDSTASFSGTSDLIPAFVAGVSVTPRKGLDIGISYRPRIDFDAPGHLVVGLSPVAAKIKAAPDGDSANLKLSLAGMLRAGVAYQIAPRLRVELDGVLEQWSALQQIRIATHNINITSGIADPTPLPDIVFEKHFKDAWSARLGGDFGVLPGQFTLRAGYVFETSAIDRNYASMDFPNWQRHVASLGASVRLFGAWLDVAYAHHFVETQHVTDSQVVSQVSPQLGKMAPAVSSVVGNGDYESRLDVLSLALRIPFGELTAQPFAPPPLPDVPLLDVPLPEAPTASDPVGSPAPAAADKP